jgi:hypothetical protein
METKTNLLTRPSWVQRRRDICDIFKPLVDSERAKAVAGALDKPVNHTKSGTKEL